MLLIQQSQCKAKRMKRENLFAPLNLGFVGFSSTQYCYTGFPERAKTKGGSQKISSQTVK